jgi:hypothetical protein
MGAPSPELCNLWLARAFNAQDVDAAAAMYHPEASIVQVDDVHGGTSIARGADAIRNTMAAATTSRTTTSDPVTTTGPNRALLRAIDLDPWA